MISIRPIYYLIGILLSGLAVSMIVPAMVERFIYHSAQWQPFALGTFVCGTVGLLMSLANHSSQKIELKVKEAFILTSLSWIILSIFASLPFYWANEFSNFTDAWFESVSALTTTGTTVLKNLDNAPRGILLWRSMLQWFGGTGIIVMAMTVLPVLHIGGMQLFRNEFSDRSEKILPRVSQISAAILSIYTIFTLVCGTCLYLAGMSQFDAVCHAMTTVSTGGLSTHDLSVGYFNSFLIEFIITFFMFIGGTTFILLIKAWQGNGLSLLKDHQFRSYALLCVLLTFFMAAWNWQNNDMSFFASLRASLFCVVSFLSSTGFATTDYITWGAFPLIIIFLLTLSGGCTGSTSGGIKIFRLQVMFLGAHAHLRQLYRPHGIYLAAYQSHKIPESVSASVLTFITLYCFSGFCLALALATTGMDFTTSLSAAMAALGNAGPGVTDMVGPVATYAPFAAVQKIVLMIGMLLGRLELLTILVLFMPSFWRP